MKFLFKKIMKLLMPLIVIGLVVFYAFEVEPKLLITTEIEINISQNPTKSTKIIAFSDTHYTADTGLEELNRLVEKINQENADIVVFLGDLIDDQENSPIKTNLVTEAFKNIDAKYAKYAIMGNHDYGGAAEKIYKEIMFESGFNLLINSDSYIDDLDLKFVGIDDYFFGKPDTNMMNMYLQKENIILLTHAGDIVDRCLETYDLALSGHSHGGQINIPIIRDFVTPDGAEKYVKGYYEEEKIYATSGIGTTKIGARLFNFPEIVAITLNYS